jgi:hypothetical protein
MYAVGFPITVSDGRHHFRQSFRRFTGSTLHGIPDERSPGCPRASIEMIRVNSVQCDWNTTIICMVANCPGTPKDVPRMNTPRDTRDLPQVSMTWNTWCLNERHRSLSIIFGRRVATMKYWNKQTAWRRLHHGECFKECIVWNTPHAHWYVSGYESFYGTRLMLNFYKDTHSW